MSTTPAGSDEWRRRLESVLGTPATDGNEVRVLRNGVEIFPAMLEAIDNADRSVDLVTFVYWHGDIAQRFASALARAARRGCRVRVLLDAVGARKVRDDLIDEMEGAGCVVRWFRPVAGVDLGDANHRTHRKILVCDSAVGFTGGVGIADEWDGDARDQSEWRDTHLRIEGPAVAGLQAGFIDNWADENDDAFDPASEHLVSERAVGSSTMSVIRGSGEETYAELLDAGVDVQAYATSMMHAKVAVVDGVIATVGSANVNRRSTQFDEEANVVLFDPDLIATLEEHLADDLRSANQIDPADWAERGLLQRAGEQLSDVVSRWL